MIWWHSQRRVVVLVWHCGSGDQSWKHQTYPPFGRFALAWNKGRIVGQKRPLKPKHVWAIRVRVELVENHRALAFFNMAIDSKLRGCDLVKMKIVDVIASGQIKERASVLQSKTQKPVRCEISERTRASVAKWMEDDLMGMRFGPHPVAPPMTVLGVTRLAIPGLLFEVEATAAA